MRKSSKREFSVLVERDEDGYFVASVPALPGCHTQARSLDKLMDRIREAIELCLEVNREVPSPTEFVGVQRGDSAPARVVVAAGEDSDPIRRGAWARRRAKSRGA